MEYYWLFPGPYMKVWELGFGFWMIELSIGATQDGLSRALVFRKA